MKTSEKLLVTPPISIWKNWNQVEINLIKSNDDLNKTGEGKKARKLNDIIGDDRRVCDDSVTWKVFSFQNLQEFRQIMKILKITLLILEKK